VGKICRREKINKHTSKDALGTHLLNFFIQLRYQEMWVRYAEGKKSTGTHQKIYLKYTYLERTMPPAPSM